VLYLVALKSDNDSAKADVAAYLASISQSCWNEFDGIWFVKSEAKATEIRDELMIHAEPNDRITVAYLAGFAAWHGFDPECEDWLLKHQ
jgi:hypothetical protein